MSTILEVLQDGRQHTISQAEYDSLLEVLPPVCVMTRFQGQQWDFGCIDRSDQVYLLRKQGEDCLAVKSPYLHPDKAGTFEQQRRRWKLMWIELASQNIPFGRTGNFPVDTLTWKEYASDQELHADLPLHGWRRGQALFIDNLCFIKLADDVDDWLGIKDRTALGTMSFQALFDAGGSVAVQALLDAMRAVVPEECTPVASSCGGQE